MVGSRSLQQASSIGCQTLAKPNLSTGFQLFRSAISLKPSVKLHRVLTYYYVPLLLGCRLCRLRIVTLCHC